MCMYCSFAVVCRSLKRNNLKRMIYLIMFYMDMQYICARSLNSILKNCFSAVSGKVCKAVAGGDVTASSSQNQNQNQSQNQSTSAKSISTAASGAVAQQVTTADTQPWILCHCITFTLQLHPTSLCIEPATVTLQAAAKAGRAVLLYSSSYIYMWRWFCKNSHTCAPHGQKWAHCKWEASFL